MRLFKYLFRELSNNQKFSLLFVLNLTMGLAGFVALDGFKNSLDQTIKSRSKILLGADLGVSARRPMSPKEELIVQTQLGLNIEDTKMTEVFSMVSNPNKKSRLMQIRAVENNYPFYGQVELRKFKGSSEEAHKNLNQEQGLWVHPEVLSQLDVSIGDKLNIGQGQFQIIDVIEADSASGFTTSIAPRIYMNHESLEKTQLIQVGSLAWYSVLYKVPNTTNEKLTELRDQIFDQIDSPELQVFTHEKSSEQLAGLIKTLNDFLGLASLVALFLAAIGTVFLVRSYFSSKVDQIAILITLGVTPNLTFGFYLMQIFVLGTLSSLFAGLLGLLIVPLIGGLTKGLLPFNVEFVFDPSTFVLGFLVGSVGSVLMCLPLCMNLRNIKPSRLLSKEQSLGESSNWKNLTLNIMAFLPAVLFFWVLAYKLSNSFKIGSFFIIIFLGSSLALALISLVLFRPFVFYNQIQSLSLKWALRDLTRDRLTTATSFVAIGIGILLLNLIPQVQKSVQSDLENPMKSKIPSFFMFDIQEEQLDVLKELVKKEGAEIAQASPTIRARLIEVNGLDFNKDNKKLKNKKLNNEQERELRMRNRGFNLSYRDELDASEKIVEGVAFSKIYQEESNLPAEISVEKDFAKTLGLKVKDKLVFEIDGIPVEGIVINLRSVKWSSFQPNFFIQFQPGSLDLAPKTFVTTIKNLSEDHKLKLQDVIVDELPNVSIIDVSRVIQRIFDITNQILWALQFMALLCFIAGFIVIYSIANHQASLKKWDIGLLKTLGASFETIRNQFLWQYVLISLVATLFGIGISLIVSYLISTWIFETPWKLHLTYPLISLLGCIAVSLFVTLIAINQSLKTKTVDLFSN